MNQEFPDNTEIPAGGFYIPNSGAVILAAFLPVLFKNIGWIKDEKITALSSAVLAIDFAVNGHSTPGENDLFLPKLLCGLEINFVMDPEIKLGAQEKQEINEMIVSVLQYWSVLKDTSVQGLQESFLQRRGILTPQANDWLLQVEERTIDLLMDKIPWSISMIKLPWMKGVLRTSWR